MYRRELTPDEAVWVQALLERGFARDDLYAAIGTRDAFVKVMGTDAVERLSENWPELAAWADELERRGLDVSSAELQMRARLDRHDV